MHFLQLICTVTPASSNMEETHNTLKFASRAKRVEIYASRNRVICLDKCRRKQITVIVLEIVNEGFSFYRLLTKNPSLRSIKVKFLL